MHALFRFEFTYLNSKRLDAILFPMAKGAFDVLAVIKVSTVDLDHGDQPTAFLARIRMTN